MTEKSTLYREPTSRERDKARPGGPNHPVLLPPPYASRFPSITDLVAYPVPDGFQDRRCPALQKSWSPVYPSLDTCPHPSSTKRQLGNPDAFCTFRVAFVTTSGFVDAQIKHSFIDSSAKYPTAWTFSFWWSRFTLHCMAWVNLSILPPLELASS